MNIEKSLNHKNFFVQDRVLYEKLTNGRSKTVRVLDFHYPDKEICTEDHITYLNKHHEHYNKKPLPPEPQLDLFSM